MARAQAFCEHYYTVFDTNRQGLGGLYRADSLLTFEGEKLQGQESIVNKLIRVGPCKHHVDSLDAHPSPSPGGIIVFVTGKLTVRLHPQAACGHFPTTRGWDLLGGTNLDVW